MFITSVIFGYWTAISAIAMLVYLLYAGQPDPNLPQTKLPKEEMRKHLVYKAFYANPADGRGWVPKTMGFGWTVNFRTRQRVHFFIFLMLAVVLGALLGSVGALA